MIALLAGLALASPPPDAPKALVGAHFGVTDSSGALGVSAWPRVEAGCLLPGGRVAGLGEVGFTRASAKDQGTEPQKYTYTATVSDLRLGVGPEIRLARPGESIAPEVGLAAELHVLWVGVATKIRGVDSGDVGEQLVRGGGVARFGIAAAAGKGEIPVDLVFDVVPLGGDLAGQVTETSFGLSIGWRMGITPKKRED